MSISLVEKEIKRFLKSPDAEVICIRGKWGVGKTYGWNAFMHQAKDRGAIALKSYAYVSLFGINSLEQLKYAIFENKVETDNIGIEPSVETFKSNASAVIERLGLKSLGIIASLPQARNYASAFQSLSFLSVRRTVVCFDDLERKGDQLRMKDVMGLIAHLRDQKECKVALILNDDQLDNSTDKDDFARYNEKVIDASLLFKPDPSDCVRIAVTGSGQAQEWLRSAVVTLGISNIRIIKKIEQLILRVEPLVKDLDPKVLRQAVQSLTLLSWSTHSKGAGNAPSLEFLRNKRGKGLYGGMGGDEPETDTEKEWNMLLDEFEFTTMDEFDLVLLEGIHRGFFDERVLGERGRNLDEMIKESQAEGSFSAAWDLYHDSFDDNEDEVVEGIFAAFHRNVQIVTPINLNGTVRLLKDLGQPEKAAQAIAHYMEQRTDSRDFFDIANYPFEEDITDPDVRDAFETKYHSFVDNRSPVEALVRIAMNQSWSRDDIVLLSKLSADGFYAIFKEIKGKDLSRIVKASLAFGGIGNAEEGMKQISARAEEALVRIGRESLINRRRVEKKYGITVGD